MSHEIWTQAGGHESFLTRKPAWHQLGTVMTEDLHDLEEGIERAGINFVMEKRPLYIDGPEGRIDTDRVQIVRLPFSGNPFTLIGEPVSTDYGLLNPIDLARATNPLAKQWPVETVGALKGGETIFFTLDAGTGIVAGEEVRQYFLVSDNYANGKALHVVFTPVRVVCANTLSMGLSQTIIDASIQHVDGLAGEFQFRIDLIGQMQRALESGMEALNQLGQTKITPEQAQTVFTAAVPDPPKPKKVRLLNDIQKLGVDAGLNQEQIAKMVALANTYDQQMERVKATRTTLGGLYDRINDEFSEIAGTAWAAYNAVTEYADHHTGRATAAEQTLFGGLAQMKFAAFGAASKLAAA